MKPITEQERQSLVRQLTDSITDLSSLKNDPDAEWCITVYQIALDSLSSATLIHVPEDLTISDVGVAEYTSGRIHGWNECIREIKRLNGIKE